jgi:hypothetical protein
MTGKRVTMEAQNSKQADGKGKIQKAVKAGKKTAEKIVTAGNEAFAVGYERLVGLTREQLEQVYPVAADRFGDLASFGKSNVKASLAEGSRLGALSVKAANEAIEPISARLGEAVDVIAKPVSA